MRVLKFGQFEPLRWGHYVASKRRDQTINWRSVISQKNGVLTSCIFRNYEICGVHGMTMRLVLCLMIPHSLMVYRKTGCRNMVGHDVNHQTFSLCHYIYSLYRKMSEMKVIYLHVVYCLCHLPSFVRWYFGYIFKQTWINTCASGKKRVLSLAY